MVRFYMLQLNKKPSPDEEGLIVACHVSEPTSPRPLLKEEGEEQVV